jgi:hypothetical protein
MVNARARQSFARIGNDIPIWSGDIRVVDKLRTRLFPVVALTNRGHVHPAVPSPAKEASANRVGVGP